MRHEPQIAGLSLGYVSSGRFLADSAKEEAMRRRDLARDYFRTGCPNHGRLEMRRALRAWKNFRFYRERIIQ